MAAIGANEPTYVEAVATRARTAGRYSDTTAPQRHGHKRHKKHKEGTVVRDEQRIRALCDSRTYRPNAGLSPCIRPTRRLADQLRITKARNQKTHFVTFVLFVANIKIRLCFLWLICQCPGSLLRLWLMTPSKHNAQHGLRNQCQRDGRHADQSHPARIARQENRRIHPPARRAKALLQVIAA